MAPSVAELLSRHTPTRGGVSETLKNADTVMPTGVLPAREVTTLTPLGHWPSAARNCSGNMPTSLD